MSRLPTARCGTVTQRSLSDGQVGATISEDGCVVTKVVGGTRVNHGKPRANPEQKASSYSWYPPCVPPPFPFLPLCGNATISMPSDVYCASACLTHVGTEKRVLQRRHYISDAVNKSCSNWDICSQMPSCTLRIQWRRGREPMGSIYTVSVSSVTANN